MPIKSGPITPNIIKVFPSMEKQLFNSLIVYFAKGEAMKISLCMIVKNEEDFIGECLNRVLPLVDEAIIVDTGSTDNTLGILEGFGSRIKVRHFKWCDDFSAARNEALRGAVGNWIVTLDADEFLTCDYNKLRALLKTAKDDAYIITIYDAGGEGISKDVTRVFRNKKIKYKGALHEQLVGIKTIGYIDEKLAAITHFGYQPSVMEKKGKVERNKRILNLMLQDSPNDPTLLYCLGNIYTTEGKAQQALDILLNVLPQLNNNNKVRYNACQNIIINYFLSGRIDECRLFIEEQIQRKDYAVPFFFYMLGDCYYRLGNYRDALLKFLDCLKPSENKNLSSMTGFDGFLAKLRVAETLAILKQPAKATRWFIEAILDKNNVKRVGLGEAREYVRKNAPEQVSQEFERCLKNLGIH